MKCPRLLLALVLCGLCSSPPARAEQGSRLDQVLDAIIANERELASTLEQYRPLVETYLQTVKPDAALGSVPVKDSYFFGRLVLAEKRVVAAGGDTKKTKKTLSLFDDFHSATFKPESFARMLILDRGAFDREHYDFDFVRSEFLGEIRVLVFDVVPKQGKALNRLRTGRFTGRIWVEDQDYHIVRYNGVYAAALTAAFHFDSWRLEMAPGRWLPAYVYTEESERSLRQLHLTHRGQIRIWGYDIERHSAEDEFTRVLVDAPQTSDPSEAAGQISPVESARAWEGEAEDNVVRRLERAGLLAPEGPVDRVLETVVTNLEVTNSLDIQPPVRCRVLLTTPLESFTVGHTIVLSRGLIDVLPDEASLAMVLAHELGHVLSGHDLSTSYAFTDQVLVGDRQVLDRFLFERDPAEEVEADDTAVALLEKSPYAGGLAGAGLFLKALAAKAQHLPALIRPHFGNRMAKDVRLYRMKQIVDAAPELDPTSMEQTAALPLGSRVKLDPWSARIELMKTGGISLLSAREKMPFQVTPLMPYLARYGSRGGSSAADGAAVEEKEVASDRSRSETR
jgi:hypothetical protein